MPQPEPQTDEGHDAFMDRCMSDDVMQEEYPEEDQRLAVCETQWEKDRAQAPPAADRVVERRCTALDGESVTVETRDDGSQKIVGLAAVYYDGTPRTEYELWEGVRERIKRGAFAALLKEGTDTRALFNHEADNVLGRTTTNTLKLKSTVRGLEYEIRPPDTQVARDLLKLLERGDITGSSFSFLIGEEVWKDEDGGEVREIKKISKLFDVGPVTFPAYEATDAGLRSVQTAHDKAAHEDARRRQFFESRRE